MHRSAVCGAVLLVAGLLALGPVHGLINPNYTPAHLVRAAKVILRVRVGPPKEDGTVPVEVVKALQGVAPQKLALEVDRADAQLMENLGEVLNRNEPTAALYFGGDFSAAQEDAAAKKPVAALHVGTLWVALFPADGEAKVEEVRLRLGPDVLNLKAVWDGGDAMLERAVEYILSDPRADVPVASGASWTGAVRLEGWKGAARGCLAVQLAPEEPVSLVVLGENGDRLFRCAVNGKDFEDLTAKVKLASRSQCAACGDFNGDGRLDLAVCDGRTVRLLLMTAAGTFETQGPGVAPEWGVLNLAACAAGDRAGLVASAPGVPLLLVLGKDGQFTAQKLPEGEDNYGIAGTAGLGVVADFDGDGVADLVRPCGKGAWFYKGQATGGFAAPTIACDVDLGCLAAAFCGDYDADGRLDVLLAGEQGFRLLVNQGAGRFEEVKRETGEACYSAQGRVVGGASCDLNCDGREDFILLCSGKSPLPFFNRGFRCFGYAAELDLKDAAGLEAAKSLMDGQQCGTVADLDGDGLPEVALVSQAGELWVLHLKPGDGFRRCVAVAPPLGTFGPVRVQAVAGQRNLGARLAAPGSPALFGVLNKGPLRLEWQSPGGKAQTQPVNVVAPAQVQLPAAQ